jgi:hypothetical protein
MVCLRHPAPLVASVAIATAAAACEPREVAHGGAQPSSSTARATEPAGSAAGSASDSVDGGPAPYEGPWIEAVVLQAPIMSETEWPNDRKGDRDVKSARIGYMRYGEKTPVVAGEPRRKANCADGWFELVSGGFVCGKYATLDLEHPKLKLITSPDLEGPLPYAYGINVANGTPLYRQVPSRDARMKLEPWLQPKPKRAKTADDNPYAPPAPPPPDAGAVDASAVGEDAGDVPWWQKEVPDGGPPPVTLEDLQETGGPIVRRMVKGFFLSLDHQFPASGAMWWKTVAGLVTPADRILVAKPLTDFHGVWLNREAATFATKSVPPRRIDKLPVAFVLSRYAKQWSLDPTHKHASVTDVAIDRFEAVGLTGERATPGGIEYWETDEGWWVRAMDATKTDPGPAGDKLGEHDKWIDVNLKRQTLVAFEGVTPVFATIVSSGRNEHETPPGSFHIREKHIAATMDGDADTATDGPYSIEDVPYIEYFNGGYALHGAFWHSAFGQVKSHGCVNLAPWDAKALFGWTDPQLPDGWHAVFATKEKPGTRVVVHERGIGTCQGPKAEPPQCPDRP